MRNVKLMAAANSSVMDCGRTSTRDRVSAPIYFENQQLIYMTKIHKNPFLICATLHIYVPTSPGGIKKCAHNN